MTTPPTLTTHRSLLPLLLLTLLLLILPQLAHADGLIIIPHPPGGGIPGHFTFAPLEVTYHKVETTIEDQLAVTSVDQEFYNPNNARLEGDYIFPIPEGAQINKFTMDIDGKSVAAELLSADKARTIYEDIVRKARDPALLEYSGRALYRVRIFPIEPNGKKHITLKYTQLLKSDNNLLDYHYTLNTEKYSSKPLKNLSLKITIKSTEPLTNLYSPTHDVEIKRHGASEATVGFEAKDVRPDTDFHLFIGHKAAPVGLSLLTYKPDPDKEGYFVLLASPTATPADIKPMPKDVVFILDTSGSMSGDKITQAKKALKFCINTLHDNDRFNIVRFSTEAEPLFKELQTSDADHRKQALTFIDGLTASGGTAIDEALKIAVSQRTRNQSTELRKSMTAPVKDNLFMLVFITDGQPTIGEQNPDKILASVKDNPNAQDTRIFCFGVGTDVNTKLLDQLASQTKAATQYVLPTEDLELPVSNFFAKVQDPIMTNLKLRIGTLGDPPSTITVGKLYPRELPDLFKGEQLVLFGTYTASEKTQVAILDGTMNGKPVAIEQAVTFEPKTDSSREWIGKLWAVRRVGFLLDELRLHGESKELKDEVTELSRRWGIVTPYTAMLIIEDEKAHGVAEGGRTLRDMENDRIAMRIAGDNVAGLKHKESTGKGAVSGSLNISSLGDNKSLDSFAQAAVQSNERLRSNTEGADLARTTATPTSNPSTPGSWVYSTASNASVSANQGYRTITNYAQQNRQIAGKTFYLNANQWTDQSLQKSDPKQKTIKIVFASDDYFNLLQQSPEIAQYFSLGNNVTFTFNKTVYEVTDEPTK